MAYKNNDELQKIRDYLNAQLNAPQYKFNPNAAKNYYQTHQPPAPTPKTTTTVKKDTSNRHTLLDTLKNYYIGGVNKLVDTARKDLSDGFSFGDIADIAKQTFVATRMPGPEKWVTDGIFNGQNSQAAQSNGVKGFMGKTGTNLTAGVGDLTKGVGDTMRMLANDTPGGNILHNAGENISNFADQNLIKPYEKPYDKEFTWNSLLDPNFYATSGARALPFTLSLIAPSLAGAKVGTLVGEGVAAASKFGTFGKAVIRSLGTGLGASTVSAPLEAAFEASSVYDQALKDGHDDATAHSMANTTFWKNEGLLMASQTPEFAAMFGPLLRKGTQAAGTSILKNIAKAAGATAGSAALEGGQEALQEVISAHAQGKKVDPAAWKEAGALGAIMGGGMTAATHLMGGEGHSSVNPTLPNQTNGPVTPPNAAPPSAPSTPTNGPSAPNDPWERARQVLGTDGDPVETIRSNVRQQASDELKASIKDLQDNLESQGYAPEEIPKHVDDFIATTPEGLKLIQEEVKRFENKLNEAPAATTTEAPSQALADVIQPSPIGAEQQMKTITDNLRQNVSDEAVQMVTAQEQAQQPQVEQPVQTPKTLDELTNQLKELTDRRTALLDANPETVSSQELNAVDNEVRNVKAQIMKQQQTEQAPQEQPTKTLDERRQEHQAQQQNQQQETPVQNEFPVGSKVMVQGLNREQTVVDNSDPKKLTLKGESDQTYTAWRVAVKQAKTNTTEQTPPKNADWVNQTEQDIQNGNADVQTGQDGKQTKPEQPSVTYTKGETIYHPGRFGIEEMTVSKAEDTHYVFTHKDGSGKIHIPTNDHSYLSHYYKSKEDAQKEFEARQKEREKTPVKKPQGKEDKISQPPEGHQSGYAIDQFKNGETVYWHDFRTKKLTEGTVKSATKSPNAKGVKDAVQNLEVIPDKSNPNSVVTFHGSQIRDLVFKKTEKVPNVPSVSVESVNPQKKGKPYSKLADKVMAAMFQFGQSGIEPKGPAYTGDEFKKGDTVYYAVQDGSVETGTITFVRKPGDAIQDGKVVGLEMGSYQYTTNEDPEKSTALFMWGMHKHFLFADRADAQIVAIARREVLKMVAERKAAGKDTPKKVDAIETQTAPTESENDRNLEEILPGNIVTYYDAATKTKKQLKIPKGVRVAREFNMTKNPKVGETVAGQYSEIPMLVTKDFKTSFDQEYAIIREMEFPKNIQFATDKDQKTIVVHTIMKKLNLIQAIEGMNKSESSQLVKNAAIGYAGKQGDKFSFVVRREQGSGARVYIQVKNPKGGNVSFHFPAHDIRMMYDRSLNEIDGAIQRAEKAEAPKNDFVFETSKENGNTIVTIKAAVARFGGIRDLAPMGMKLEEAGLKQRENWNYQTEGIVVFKYDESVMAKLEEQFGNKPEPAAPKQPEPKQAGNQNPKAEVKPLGVIDESIPLPTVAYKETKTQIVATFKPIQRQYVQSIFKDEQPKEVPTKTLTFPKGKDHNGYNEYIRLPKGASVGDINDWLGIEFYQEGVTAPELIATFDMMNGKKVQEKAPKKVADQYKGRSYKSVLTKLSTETGIDIDSSDGQDLVSFVDKFYDAGFNDEPMPHPDMHPQDAVKAYDAGKQDKLREKPKPQNPKTPFQALQDMGNLEVIHVPEPKAPPKNVTADPSKYDKARADLEWLDALADRADAYIKKNKNRMNALPLDLFGAGVIVGARKIAHGVIDFAEWSNQMMKEYGKELKLSLPGLWAQSQAFLTYSHDDKMEYLNSAGVGELADGLNQPAGETITLQNGDEVVIGKEYPSVNDGYTKILSADENIVTVELKMFDTVVDGKGQWDYQTYEVPRETFVKNNFLWNIARSYNAFTPTETRSDRPRGKKAEQAPVEGTKTKSDLELELKLMYQDAVASGTSAANKVKRLEKAKAFAEENKVEWLESYEKFLNRAREAADSQKQKKEQEKNPQPPAPQVEKQHGEYKKGDILSFEQHGTNYTGHVVDSSINGYRVEFFPGQFNKSELSKPRHSSRNHNFTWITFGSDAMKTVKKLNENEVNQEFDSSYLAALTPDELDHLLEVSTHQQLRDYLKEFGRYTTPESQKDWMIRDLKKVINELPKGSETNADTVRNNGDRPLEADQSQSSEGTKGQGSTGEGSNPSPRGDGGRNSTDVSGTAKDGPTAEVEKPSGRSDSQQYADETSGRNELGNSPGRSVKSNFVITNELDSFGSAKERYRGNIEAVQLLQKLKAEDRFASSEEQKVLARYVGWGGIVQAFGDINGNPTKGWEKEFAEMNQLVTDGVITKAEYNEMKESSLYAHYTSKTVIDAMYDAVRQLGFAGGRILEPSVGVGNFFGLLPTSIAKGTTFTGVEKEPITGRIAQQLYQKANIEIKEYQDFDIPDGYFDLGIGNPPFHQTTFKYEDGNKYSLHNYFFVKTLDKVRDGGLMAFVSSTGTMNTQNAVARQKMGEKADFLGAIRLPGSAFKENAGTEVTTDILFFQKRPAGQEANHRGPFLETFLRKVTSRDGENVEIRDNVYFREHPEMILGNVTTTKNVSGHRLGVTPNGDLEKQLQEAIANLPEKIMTEPGEKVAEVNYAEEITSSLKAELEEGNFAFENGQLIQKVQGRMVARPDKKGADIERIKGLIQLRDTTKKLLSMQHDGANDADVNALMKALNKHYDAFVKKYKNLNTIKNMSVLKSDPLSLSLLISLEKEVNGKWVKQDIFKERVLGHIPDVTKAETPEEALVLSLNKHGRVNLEHMSALLDKPQESIIADLGDRLYEDPNEGWTTSDDYLSGHVRKKLERVKGLPQYERNQTALEKVIPEDIPSDDIFIQFGSPFVSAQYVEGFLNEFLGQGRTNVKVSFIPGTGEWLIDGKIDNVRSNEEYGVSSEERGGSSLSGFDIIELVLNNKDPKVTYIEGYDANDKPIRKPDMAATALARQIAEDLQNQFVDWLWSDKSREKAIAERYNYEYNGYVHRDYDGSIVYGGDTIETNQPIPGFNNKKFRLRKHQKNVVWRMLQGGNALLAHVVGAGKTLEMIVAGMEMKRLGFAKKPAYVVPVSLVEQWQKDFRDSYPNANILVLSNDLIPSVATTKTEITHDVPLKGDLLSHVNIGDKVKIAGDSKRFYFAGMNGGKAVVVRITDKKLKTGNLIASIHDLQAQGRSVSDMKQIKGIEYMEIKRGDVQQKYQAMSDAEWADKQEEHRVKRAAELNKIVMGNYDAIIISHETFKRLSMSAEAYQEYIREQMEEVRQAIVAMEADKEKKKTVKELEGTLLALGEKLSNSLDEDNKDIAIPFERLGIDQLFVDEAHKFKNLGFHTKMTRIAGLSNTEAKRSVDMFVKTRWLSKLRDGRGVVFATGTPISNTMAELYNMMRYLQWGRLKELGITHFDSWANMFGITENSIEMDVAGGFKERNRFKRFQNVRELLKLWKETTDVKTAKMLDLPRPKNVKFTEVVTKLTPEQEAYLQEIVARAGVLEGGNFDPAVDNWLKLTGDARKMSVDIRLVENTQLDHPNSKVNSAVKNIFNTWKEGTAERPDKGGEPIDKLAQLVFLDLGTPKEKKQNEDGEDIEPSEVDGGEEVEKIRFDIYSDMRKKLIARGVPSEQIAFIHEAKTKKKKEKLMEDVRKGKVRILMGSTEKMGAGMNVQERLVALHHIDAPWRPSDVEQREGRIIRQGNRLDDVHVFTYITEGSFDQIMWDMLKNKAAFVEQMMNGDENLNEMEDVGALEFRFAHVSAAASGDTTLIDKMNMDKTVKDLKGAKEQHRKAAKKRKDRIHDLETNEIPRRKRTIARVEKEAAKVVDVSGDKFKMSIDGNEYTTRKEAAEALDVLFKANRKKIQNSNGMKVGVISGFDVLVKVSDSDKNVFKVMLDTGEEGRYNNYYNEESPSGTISRIENLLSDVTKNLKYNRQWLNENQVELEDLIKLGEPPFKKEKELEEALAKQRELDQRLLTKGKTETLANGEVVRVGNQVTFTYEGQEVTAPITRLIPRTEEFPARIEVKWNLSETSTQTTEIRTDREDVRLAKVTPTEQTPTPPTSQRTVKGLRVEVKVVKHTQTDSDVWAVKVLDNIENYGEFAGFMSRNGGNYYDVKTTNPDFRRAFVFRTNPEPIFDKDTPIADELTNRINARNGDNQGIVAPLFRGRQRNQSSRKYAFDNLDIRQRTDDAMEIPKEKLLTKVKDWLERQTNRITREYEYLPHTAEFSPLRHELLRLEKQRSVAMEQTARNLHSLLIDLNRDQYELFRNIVITADLMEEAKQGHELAFGFTEESLKHEYDRAMGYLAGEPLVKESLNLRKKLWDSIKNDYTKVFDSIGVDVSGKFEKENYFRHKVIEFAKTYRDNKITGKKELKTPKGQGYMKHRYGSEKDFVTDYLLAESEVMSNMLFDMEVATTVKLVDDNYNEEKNIMRGVENENKKSYEKLIAREKAETAERDRLESLGHTVDEINDIMSRSYNELPTRVKEVMARYITEYNLKLGKKQETQVEAVAAALKNRVGWAYSNLKKLAEDGNLWTGKNGEYQSLVDDLASGIDNQEKNKWFEFLSDLLSSGQVGSKDAAMFLRYVRLQKTYKKDLIGEKDFKTLKNSIPDGYSEWLPDKTNLFYMAQTLPDYLAEQLFNGTLDTLTEADFTKAMVNGGKRKGFIVKNEVKKTLENLMDPAKFSTWRSVSGSIKSVLLVGPINLFKYNARNMTGDLEKVITGSPDALKYVPKAVMELQSVFFRHAAPTKELQEWLKYGGMQTLIQSQEFGDIKHLAVFRDKVIQKEMSSFAKVLNVPVSTWNFYWNSARKLTDYRESILRYAAFLSYLKQIETNNGKPKNYGASLRQEINALDGKYNKAFNLSNDLLIAYDKTSATGKKLRDTIFSFFSFTEGNIRSYIRVFKNAYHDDDIARAVGSKLVTTVALKSPMMVIRTGRLAMKLGFITVLLALYNNLFHPDEEKDLPDDVRNTVHIILGRDNKGNVIYFNRLGTLEDFLGWFGLDDADADIRDILNGKRTFLEVIEADAWKPVNKAVQLVHPLAQQAVEQISGMKYFPDFRNPTRVSDRVQELMGLVSASKEYAAIRDSIVGRPHKDYKTSNWVAYSSDPEETNYYNVRDHAQKAAEKYLDKHKSTMTGKRSEKSQYLYEIKVGLHYHDRDYAQKYLEKYMAVGGSERGLKQSLNSLNPLSVIPKDLRQNYYDSLDENEKNNVERATKYYQDVLLDGFDMQ